MFIAARALVMRSLFAMTHLLFPLAGAAGRVAERRADPRAAALPGHRQAGVAAGVVNVVVHEALVVDVVADQVRVNSGISQAAVEGLFGVGKAFALRRRRAGLPVTLEAPRR